MKAERDQQEKKKGKGKKKKTNLGIAWDLFYSQQAQIFTF